MNAPLILDRALSIEGWMLPDELEWLATQAQSHLDICEVGCWKGRSTRALLDNTPGVVWAVDHWEGPHNMLDHPSIFHEIINGGPTFVYDQFYANMAPHYSKVNIVPKSSLKAAEYFKLMGVTFDMVFIDADHAYEYMKADIEAYRPLVRPGGLLCGHDYHPDWSGVIQAVQETLPGHDHAGAIWFITL